jgi:hypothetical protein
LHHGERDLSASSSARSIGELRKPTPFAGPTLILSPVSALCGGSGPRAFRRPTPMAAQSAVHKETCSLA